MRRIVTLALCSHYFVDFLQYTAKIVSAAHLVKTGSTGHHIGMYLSRTFCQSVTIGWPSISVVVRMRSLDGRSEYSRVTVSMRVYGDDRCPICIGLCRHRQRQTHTSTHNICFYYTLQCSFKKNPCVPKPCVYQVNSQFMHILYLRHTHT